MGVAGPGVGVGIAWNERGGESSCGTRDGAAFIMMCVGHRVAAMCARGSGPRDQGPRARHDEDEEDETCGDQTNRATRRGSATNWQ